MKTAIGTICLAFAAPLVACSSDGDIFPKKERFTPSLVDAGGAKDAPSNAEPDAGPDIAGDGKKPRDPNANCVKPGTPNNERDVGGYCESGPRDCASEQGPRFCTSDFADIAPVEDDKWFCTTTCTMDVECGTGAVCLMGGIGNGCVPIVCAPDAGTVPREAGP